MIKKSTSKKKGVTPVDKSRTTLRNTKELKEGSNSEQCEQEEQQTENKSETEAQQKYNKVKYIDTRPDKDPTCNILACVVAAYGLPSNFIMLFRYLLIFQLKMDLEKYYKLQDHRFLFQNSFGNFLNVVKAVIMENETDWYKSKSKYTVPVQLFMLSDLLMRNIEFGQEYTSMINFLRTGFKTYTKKPLHIIRYDKHEFLLLSRNNDLNLKNYMVTNETTPQLYPSLLDDCSNESDNSTSSDELLLKQEF